MDAAEGKAWYEDFERERKQYGITLNATLAGWAVGHGGTDWRAVRTGIRELSDAILIVEILISEAKQGLK